jgi:hypothetical protein
MRSDVFTVVTLSVFYEDAHVSEENTFPIFRLKIGEAEQKGPFLINH